MTKPPPLVGRTIVVTSPDEAGTLCSPLRELGAEVWHLPTIEFAPPRDPSDLEAAVRDINNYAWIIFVSRRAAKAWLALEPAMPESLRLAAIGTATSAVLREAGVSSDAFVPTVETAADLAEQLLAQGLTVDQRVLIPQSNIGRDTLSTRLREGGAYADVVVAYETRTTSNANTIASVREWFAAPSPASPPDAVVFTSPSTVAGLHQLAPDAAQTLAATRIFAIGPTTAAAIERLGLPREVATRHNHAGLVELICESFELR